MADDQDNPGIRVPPPLIYLLPLVVGLLLDRRSHVPFLARSVRRFLGWPLIGGGVLLFGRVTAYMGILAAIFNWGLYVPEIGIFLSILSVVPLAIWYILVARMLLQLGRAS